MKSRNEKKEREKKKNEITRREKDEEHQRKRNKGEKLCSNRGDQHCEEGAMRWEVKMWVKIRMDDNKKK